MNGNLINQNNEETLRLVEKFGFKFFGYDENSFSLVVAPNGQIVPLSVAYEFVQTQISNSQVSSGGLESMPNVPSLPVVPESTIESSIEKESSIESYKRESIEKKEDTNIQQPLVSLSPPVKKTEPEFPYGDGFKTPFNPIYIEKALDYIRKNSKKTLSSTSKWLSVQFQKFIDEQDTSK